MAISDISEADVRNALLAFDEIGRDAFLKRYGFGESRNYVLVEDGRRYDSKAVIAVAHSYARPDIGVLQARDFSGGLATVVHRLNELGFSVEYQSEATGMFDDLGEPVDATFELRGAGKEWVVVLHSRSGAAGTTTVRNPEYAVGLRLLLERLARRGAVVTDLQVMSGRTRVLSADERRLGMNLPLSLEPSKDFEALRREIGSAQAKVGHTRSTGGNPTRRIEMAVRMSKVATGPTMVELLSASGNAGPAHWLFTVNPERYRVFDQLEETGSLSPTWRLSQHWNRVRPGDDVVLWLTGPDGGVIALGVVAEPPKQTSERGNAYWVEGSDAERDAWSCTVAFATAYPRGNDSRRALAADSRFSSSEVLTPGRRRSPLRLDDQQWTAVAEWARFADEGEPTAPGEPPIEDGAGLLPGQPLRASYDLPGRTVYLDWAERRLVAAYQKWLSGRLDVAVPVRAPEQLLEADAFDQSRALLIEAKADTRRESVRMALGQLLDYERFFDGPVNRAVLLPARPADSLVELLRCHAVTIIHKDGDGFVEVDGV